MSSTLKYNNQLNILGETIKKYRIDSKLSLEQLSNKLQLLGVNLPAPAIYKIETNQRTLKDYELAGLSEVLEFSIDNELKFFKTNIKR